MRIYPLVAGAAVSVIVLSGVGVAAMTGVLPKTNAEKSTAEKAVVKEEPVKPVQKQAAAKPACLDCGTVVAVKAVEVKGEATGMGAVIGGVAGAVVGREIADRNRDVGTVVGGVGGAIAGHQIERHARTKQQFTIQVRMNDGSTRTITVDEQPAWKNGDRVRVRNGALVPHKA